MVSRPVYDMQKQKVGNIELNDAIFAAEVRSHLIHDAVRAQIAWHYEHRTANSLTRSEVSGTRKKMFRQKGTGQARHGDAKAPIFVGGGKAHGPKPRMVHYKINKKVMRAALISTLSMYQKNDQLLIVNKLSLDKCSTKGVSAVLKSFGIQKALFVNENNDAGQRAFNRGSRNVPCTKVLRPEGLNVFDILKYKNLIISEVAMPKITERFISGA